MGEDASRSVAPATDVSSMPEGPVFLDSGSAFSYRCKACGQCCRDTRVVLNPYDVICLAGHLGISTGRLVRQFLVLTPEGGFLRHRLNGDCVFLDGTKR